MQDLRNYALHRKLPSLGHSVSMTGVNTPDARFESEVKLSTGPLLEWDGWTTASKTFLAENPESISLRPVVLAHGRLVLDLNTWLFNALMSAIDLEEVNELQVKRNAILSGTDIETARRLTEQWSEEHTDPSPRGAVDRPSED
jgi:hypothetical protein